MAEIMFPSIVEKHKYSGMSPQEQEQYIQKKLKEILALNPNGITIPDIEENTPFTRPTIIKHLDRMVSSREAYPIKRRNLTVYYPNGQPNHPEYTIKEKFNTGTEVRITFLDNESVGGKFVFLEDLSTDQVHGGSLLIRLQDLPFYKNILEKAISTSKKIEN